MEEGQETQLFMVNVEGLVTDIVTDFIGYLNMEAVKPVIFDHNLNPNGQPDNLMLYSIDEVRTKNQDTGEERTAKNCLLIDSEAIIAYLKWQEIEEEDEIYRMILILCLQNLRHFVRMQKEFTLDELFSLDTLEKVKTVSPDVYGKIAPTLIEELNNPGLPKEYLPYGADAAIAAMFSIMGMYSGQEEDYIKATDILLLTATEFNKNVFGWINALTA